MTKITPEQALDDVSTLAARIGPQHAGNTTRDAANRLRLFITQNCYPPSADEPREEADVMERFDLPPPVGPMAGLKSGGVVVTDHGSTGKPEVALDLPVDRNLGQGSVLKFPIQQESSEVAAARPFEPRHEFPQSDLKPADAQPPAGDQSHSFAPPAVQPADAPVPSHPHPDDKAVDPSLVEPADKNVG